MFRWTQLSTLAVAVCLMACTVTVMSEEKDENSKLKIAGVSCIIKPGKVDHNLAQIEKWTKRAAAEGADLVLFNETSVTGYWMSSEVRALAEPRNGRIVQELTRFAKENDIVICAGMVEKAANKAHNTQVVVGPQGLLGFHRKSSFPSGEEKWHDIGRDANVFTVHGVRMGIAICFESVAPDTCRKLVRKGAKIILAPYMNGVTAEEIFGGKRPYFQERARENGVWYIACDQCGQYDEKEGKLTRAGAVCFVNPQGDIVAVTSLDETGEHMIIHEVSW